MMLMRQEMGSMLIPIVLLLVKDISIRHFMPNVLDVF